MAAVQPGPPDGAGQGGRPVLVALAVATLRAHQTAGPQSRKPNAGGGGSQLLKDHRLLSTL